MLFITLMTKMSDTTEAKYKYKNKGWTAGSKTRKLRGLNAKTGLIWNYF